jgi:hypothetical protein
MPPGPLRCIATLLICALIAPLDGIAQAHPHAAFDGLGGKSKTTLIIAALVATVAVIGVGVYFVVRQAHSVKGCVAHGTTGLQLQREGGQSFVLLGATSGIRAGERVKVTGSRRKKVSGVSDSPSFVVDKLNKDYGACTVSPAQP